jgi:hypothetical protein
MSRKIWIASVLVASSLSLLPNAAQAQWETEEQCEAQLFPYSAESTTDWTFEVNGTPDECAEGEARCGDACMETYVEETALCVVASQANPFYFALCQSVVFNRWVKCADRCTQIAIDCIAIGGGGGGGDEDPRGPLNIDPGGGSGPGGTEGSCCSWINLSNCTNTSNGCTVHWTCTSYSC